MKRFTSKTQKIGEYGEKICCKWLVNNGFTLLERNFNTKNGEIDIIVSKNDTVHFIEVKSVSRESNNKFSRETFKYINKEQYNPANNITTDKIKKCYKTIKEYKQLQNVSHETKTQFDVYLVYIDTNRKKHFIERIKNIV